MAKDYAPIGHTCPLIDEVISQINDVYRECDDVFSKSAYQDFETRMEKIRKANSTLRDWGNEKFIEAMELDKDLDHANAEIEALKREIESLKSEISMLEDDLSMKD